MNVLEEVVAEWKEMNGHFVRRNVKIGRLSHGGYGGELDILAFEPGSGVLEHIEPSAAARSNVEWSTHYEKKFRSPDTTYKEVIPLPFKAVKKLAVFKYARNAQPVKLPEGVTHQTVPSVIAEICSDLRKRDPQNAAVPEGFPLLRAMQLAVWYGTAPNKDSNEK